MKSLIVVRHAKSSWGNATLDDHDRPLNDRGERVAPLVGELLAGRIGKPDLILSSTARRARATAGLIADAFGYAGGDIVEDGRIYLANTPRLLQVLREIDEAHGSVMLFGHVPGVHELTNTLCRDAGIAHFPTCAVALIELGINYWGEISPGCGKLSEFIVPKEILPAGLG